MKAYLRERAERFFVNYIQRRGPEQVLGRGPKLLLFLLAQLSRIYRPIVQFRLFMYDKGIFRPHTLGCQVISVGNLTVGGTGKTPVVEVFARDLQREGRKVAILSRGYKKKEPGFLRQCIDKVTWAEKRRPPRVVSDGSKLLLDSSMSGDEPYMLASNLPDVCVLVDKDRIKSGRYAINNLHCDTLILDDGFQYMALKHRVEIVLVDRTNPFGNEHVLPRGILREPIANIHRAHVIFITKSNKQGAPLLRERLRQLNPHAEIVECQHCPRSFQDVFRARTMPLDMVQGMKVAVVSGIAVPGGFEDELQRLGAVILARHRFADHHRYQQQEIIDLINESRKRGAQAVITTEKDAVRFPKMERCDVPVYYLRVDIDILSGAESFEQCISRICFRS